MYICHNSLARVHNGQRCPTALRDMAWWHFNRGMKQYDRQNDGTSVFYGTSSTGVGPSPGNCEGARGLGGGWGSRSLLGTVGTVGPVLCLLCELVVGQGHFCVAVRLKGQGWGGGGECRFVGESGMLVPLLTIAAHGILSLLEMAGFTWAMLLHCVHTACMLGNDHHTATPVYPVRPFESGCECESELRPFFPSVRPLNPFRVLPGCVLQHYK